MKLRKLKTTIISSLAFIPLLAYANFKSVTEQGNNYIIVVEVEKINRTRDMQRAAIKAKAELSRYLKPQSKSVITEMKHFTLLGKKSYAEKVEYRFKIDKKHVQIIK